MISSSLSYAEAAFINRRDVQQFIHQMVKQHHFNKKQLIEWFSAVKLRHQVIKSITKPAEKEPWYLYQMLFVNEWRIQHGVEFWNRYDSTLRKAESIYGVPAAVIVATIGIETNYGKKTGDYRVMDSLSSLAFSRLPRAPFFRKELEQFLLLTREQHLDPLKVMGSYAGAIGQPQFMPSSYRYYAVNFSKSGQTDLINDEVDVIGSVANYYKQQGWMPHQPIAIQAFTLGDRYNYLLLNDKMNRNLSLSVLAKYGVLPKQKIDSVDLPVKLIELQNRYSKEYWIGFTNFDVIKRYNASDAYAMAVYQLSNYMTALKERLSNG